MDATDLRIALFSGNYNYVRDGANQALNRLVEYLLRQGARVRVYSPTVDEPAFEPAGDQPAAIAKLTEGLEAGLGRADMPLRDAGRCGGLGGYKEFRLLIDITNIDSALAVSAVRPLRTALIAAFSDCALTAPASSASRAFATFPRALYRTPRRVRSFATPSR